MTPEERFVKIETMLEMLAERQSRADVEFEKTRHEHDLRIQRLTEFQAVLMESQSDTWRALKNLSDNVEKLIRFQGRNGHGEKS